MIQPMLKPGDEIRVIAPSSAWNPDREKQYARAQKRIENLGFKLSFGKFIKHPTHLDAVDIDRRLQDLHDAYRDPNVKLIMCLTGGWVANSLLPRIDWKVIAANPKPLVGYSDITVLANSIYAKTGQVGYLGPNFGTFGSNHQPAYTQENFLKVFCGDGSKIGLSPSEKWGEGKKRRKYETNWFTLQAGRAEGVVLGGNTGTFFLLQGTEYMPEFKTDTVLLAEDDDETGEYTAREFDRRLESILQQPNARKYIKAILIGRFQTNSKVTDEEIKTIVASKKLDNVVVVAGVDFGHTQPTLTLPIGGTMLITASSSKITLEMTGY